LCHSSFEANFIRYLIYINKNYVFHPKTFDIGFKSYTPDFYIIDEDEYIELKGFKTEEIEKKYQYIQNNFIKNLKVIYQNDFYKLLVNSKLINVISNLELKYEDSIKYLEKQYYKRCIGCNEYFLIGKVTKNSKKKTYCNSLCANKHKWHMKNLNDNVYIKEGENWILKM